MDLPVIVLDVNETISDLSALAPAFEAEGVPSSLAQARFAATLRDGFALMITGDTRSFTDVARAVLVGLLSQTDTLHRRADDATDAILTAFAELPPHDDIADGIAALASAGHRIVTLSNGSASNAQALLERAGVAHSIERCIGVEDTSMWKPHPEAYLRGLEIIRIAPGDAVLTAVHPWDLHGARRAGLRTAYVDRNGTPWPGAFTPADFTVHTLVDLPALLA
ncbi:haloacid dehalogenase type II [Curtobacterium sp. ISL-83]|uniref:haloacid dehalogenase type II n=1 Tax=Curtobacterium sp. ISL-83 TaxID=2819145 RepID=UPI001BE5B30B|nr:haloacid dehalogenase type II [Curtobacterium sp. ISL-83]MBT2501205.1 haloacid dehalogenase type II [Curtobacterium sp. ISL-83]